MTNKRFFEGKNLSFVHFLSFIHPLAILLRSVYPFAIPSFTYPFSVFSSVVSGSATAVNHKLSPCYFRRLQPLLSFISTCKMLKNVKTVLVYNITKQEEDDNLKWVHHPNSFQKPRMLTHSFDLELIFWYLRRHKWLYSSCVQRTQNLQW